MKIAVTATGPDLNSPVDPRFGRCQYFVIVDTDTMEVTPLQNEAMMAGGGAGIQAAQFISDKGVNGVITGNVGPNAWSGLSAAGITIYQFAQGTVGEAIDLLKQGKLQPVSSSSVPSHFGMGGGMDSGMGPGMGPGMGRGGGRGMGGGRW